MDRADRASSPSSADSRVLLIDDDDLIVRSLQHALVTEGCEVDTARDAAMADELMSCRDYAVIAVDPYLTGEIAQAIAILGSIRARQPRSQLIVLTAYLSGELSAEARAQRALGVIEKPKSLPFLMHLLTAVRRIAAAQNQP